MGPDKRDCLGEETCRPPKVKCMGEWSLDLGFFIWHFKPVWIEVMKKSRISRDLFSCVG